MANGSLMILIVKGYQLSEGEDANLEGKHTNNQKSNMQTIRGKTC